MGVKMMRLIDFDALKDKEQYIPCGNGLLFHGVTAATIDAMPVVDARPVVHAKWEDGPEIKVFKEEKIPTVQCPRCLLYFGDLINNHRNVYRFCPYCGAHMDGGDSND